MPDRFFATQTFAHKLMTSTGNAFQDLFYRLMECTEPNFAPIRTQGALGDRKCDGYIRSKGIFFQVFAPIDLSGSSTQKEAISKLYEDFTKLYEHTCNGHWEEIKEFYYIVGDRGKGFYPDLEDALQQLKTDYPTISFYLKGEKYLQSIFSRIEDIDTMQQILSCYIPKPNLEPINYEIINQIISFLIAEKKPFGYIPSKLIAPDFKKKITFNKLDQSIDYMLCTANLSSYLLEEYFNSTNDDSSELLRKHLTTLYNESKKLSDDPNTQFFHIYKNIYPVDDGLDNFSQSTYYNNILIIMSLYFESCDIFEEPKEEGVS